MATPQNDQCSDAIPLIPDVPYVMDTRNASSTNDPIPWCFSSAGKGVWFSFTSTNTGPLTLTTYGSDFPASIQLVAGNCSNVFSFQCSSSGKLQFIGTNGVAYRFLVGASTGMGGTLSVLLEQGSAPNDSCFDAIPLISGVPHSNRISKSTSDDDPQVGCFRHVPDLGNGVWYRFTPSSNGIVHVTTCGSDFPTTLRVYRGSCQSLTTFVDACDDGSPSVCESNRASVVYSADAGATYYILADGLTPGGNLRIEATLLPSLNDHCDAAVAMIEGAVYTRNTFLATSAGDSNVYCGGQFTFPKSVWYSFTPPSNGVVSVSTCGSDFAPVMQIYTGQCDSLERMDDGCSEYASPNCGTNGRTLAFWGEAGVTYRFMVGGGPGSLQIRATLSPPLNNDECSGAIPLTAGVPALQNTLLATGGGPLLDGCHVVHDKDVWYSFTPEMNGVVSITTCESDFATSMAVYIGSCNTLSLVQDGCNSGYGPFCEERASVVFLAAAGTRYLIRVGAYLGSSGNLSIKASVSPQLPNDTCAGAVSLQDGVLHRFNTAHATRDGDIGDCNDYQGLKATWYRFTPLINDRVTIATFGSDSSRAIRVFNGSCGEWGQSLGCSNDVISFAGTAGETYWVQMGGLMGTNLAVRAWVRRPPNEYCFGATPLAHGVSYTNDTTYATGDAELVAVCDPTATKAVWYSFVPGGDATFTLETCGSDFETVLQVYAGDCSSPIPLACSFTNGPACGSNRASLSFAGKAGTNYFIRAAGRNGGFGKLSLRLIAPAPVADLCADAVEMSEGVVYTNNTAFATAAGEESLLICNQSQREMIWYRFTPGKSGVVTLSTCGSDFKTALAVFAGQCGTLRVLTCAIGPGPACTSDQTSLQFIASAGETYWVGVGGAAGAYGNVRLAATMQPPPNDQCSGAIPLEPGIEYSVYTANATDTNEPVPECQPNFGRGLWYSFTPFVDGLVHVTTCASDMDTALQVFTGSCASLVPVTGGCNDDNGPGCESLAASVTFPGTANVTYRILAGSFMGVPGNLRLKATVIPKVSAAIVGNHVVLKWPANSGGSVLESTTNLLPPRVWSVVPGLQILGPNVVVTNLMDVPSRFYRLKQ
ncbi:MAG TPA: hypothetical protein VEH04_11065 [Verrucomicrobiae bacterium]|nr:hypothetical protein [Verrucomicrobiae bacterium]